LVDEVQESLREPDSFEHIDTRIGPAENGSHVLAMRYRARNGFGGMNVSKVYATVRSDDCSFQLIAAAD
jgi:hypothetical protein